MLHASGETELKKDDALLSTSSSYACYYYHSARTRRERAFSLSLFLNILTGTEIDSNGIYSIQLNNGSYQNSNSRKESVG